MCAVDKYMQLLSVPFILANIIAMTFIRSLYDLGRAPSMCFIRMLNRHNLPPFNVIFAANEYGIFIDSHKVTKRYGWHFILPAKFRLRDVTYLTPEANTNMSGYFINLSTWCINGRLFNIAYRLWQRSSKQTDSMQMQSFINVSYCLSKIRWGQWAKACVFIGTITAYCWRDEHDGSCTCTVYPKKYAHGFVVLCFVVVM